MALPTIKQGELLLLLESGGELLEEALRNASNLPGPRANLEFAAQFARMADLPTCMRLAAIDAERAPVNSPDEFLTFCGVLGLGRYCAVGDTVLLARLKAHANDRRWRTREAVAMALQVVGDTNPALLRATVAAWATGTRLEQRAAVAGIAEPRLLRDPVTAMTALELIDRISASMKDATDRHSDDSGVLRQALGYAWSVVVVAAPESGRARFESLASGGGADLRWIVRENLKKKRLQKMDEEWVRRLQTLVT